MYLREHSDPAWQASVRLGEAFEDRCVRWAAAQPTTQKLHYTPKSKLPGYDFSFIGRVGNFFGHATVECKCDRRAAETGNVFVQVEKDRKPHGIHISTATHWFVNLGDPRTGKVVVVRRAELADYIKRFSKKVEGAGRSANTTGVLVSVEDFLRCPSAFTWQ